MKIGTFERLWIATGQPQTRMISRPSTRFTTTMQCWSTHSPGSGSGVGAIFRLVSRSRTRSASRCGAYSVLPTFGSLKLVLTYDGLPSYLHGEYHGVQRRKGCP